MWYHMIHHGRPHGCTHDIACEFLTGPYAHPSPEIPWTPWAHHGCTTHGIGVSYHGKGVSTHGRHGSSHVVGCHDLLTPWHCRFAMEVGPMGLIFTMATVLMVFLLPWCVSGPHGVLRSPWCVTVLMVCPMTDWDANKTRVYCNISVKFGTNHLSQNLVGPF